MPHAGPVAVDTFGGRVHVEWDAQAAVTPLGQLQFFIEFLRLGGRFDALVASCPLRLTRHGGQTRLTISHPHAEPACVEATCREIAAFFSALHQTAGQLNPVQC